VSVVVHLFGALDPGGAEVRTLEELRRRDLSGERHVFVTLSGRPGVLASEFEALGCEVIPSKLRPGFPVDFVRLLQRRRATHVHGHVHLASGYFLLLAAIARVPHRIAHLRSVGDGRPSRPTRRAYRAVGKVLLTVCATDVVAVSASVRDEVLGAQGSLAARCRILFDRIDGSRFGPAGPPVAGSLRLILVGRLDQEKNPRRAVEITAELARRRGVDGVRLQLVGRATDQSQVSEILRVADDLGIGSAIEVLGQRDDVPALLAASDVLVATTTREGLPGVIIEAAAAGIPAVVSTIPPNQEAARHLLGVVTVPLDAPDATWADAVEAAATDRAGALAPAPIRAAFDRSPFALAGDDGGLDALWS
jgi:glycosyltransferase involved in cell wall biosynthesis